MFESFRDPQGKVVLTESEVWRLVEARDAAARLEEFCGLELTRQWEQDGKLVATTPAGGEEAASFARKFKDHAFADLENFTLFKHRRVEFPSFPYEWSPEMLYDAGLLTLEAADTFFARTGWSLKDATPFNVLFEAAKPIFIDVLSFEKRDAKDPLWLPYNQFVQTFLLPLLVNKETGLPLQTVFTANRDGLPVAEAAKLLGGGFKKLKPEILSLVTLPKFLSKRAAASGAALYKPRTLDSAEQAQFVLQQSFSRLRRQLEKVSPGGGGGGAAAERRSIWTEYTDFNRETVPEYMRAKQDFVIEAVGETKPARVLDVGCNTGFFSFFAARTSGAQVVAIDNDPAVVGRVYRAAKKENLNVLPLVIDLARPSPALGWRYSETPSFLDRALGGRRRFDLVMMLAVVHHLLVQERVPLREILRLAADLTGDALVVEFVPPSDKMFGQLARGREHLHRHLTAEKFTKTAEEFFRITRSRKLPQTERVIYLMRKK